LARQGMTLDQIWAILATGPVKAEVHHASDSSVAEFRKPASSYLDQPGHFVMVSYLRKAIGQQIGGDISPLAAYEAKADRFLILGVALRIPAGLGDDDRHFRRHEYARRPG
jgi:hypothetical protein